MDSDHATLTCTIEEKEMFLSSKLDSKKNSQGTSFDQADESIGDTKPPEEKPIYSSLTFRITFGLDESLRRKEFCEFLVSLDCRNEVYLQ